MLRYLLVSMVILLTACAAPRYQFSENEVESLNQVHISRQEPDQNCRLIGPIEAADGSYAVVTFRMGTVEQTYKLLQLKAAQQNANYVVLDNVRPSTGEFQYLYILTGRAFYCP